MINIIIMFAATLFWTNQRVIRSIECP